MRICRLCENVIGDQDGLCDNCGYNPGTDMMTPSFVKKAKKKVGSGEKQRRLSPSVKKFAAWGMIIIILSLGIRYQGKVGDVIWKAKNLSLSKKDKKSAQALARVNQNKATRLIAVRSYKAPLDKTSDKNIKIEGIFYDPQGKSYVVINGQLISEKESFRDILIKEINSDSVEVVRDGKGQVLRVNK